MIAVGQKFRTIITIKSFCVWPQKAKKNVPNECKAVAREEEERKQIHAAITSRFINGIYDDNAFVL